MAEHWSWPVGIVVQLRHRAPEQGNTTVIRQDGKSLPSILFVQAVARRSTTLALTVPHLVGRLAGIE